MRLVGAAPNTEALGARVVVETDIAGQRLSQTRVVMAASNFNSQNPPDLHFGLGAAGTVARMTVYWPGGERLVCEALPANRYLVFDQRTPACPE